MREMGSKTPVRVLIIDLDAPRTEALVSALEGAGLTVAAVVPGSADVHAEVVRYAPDAILIGLESPTRDTLEGLALLGRRFPRPILMLSDASDTDLVREAAGAGISVYAAAGLSGALLRSVLTVSAAQFEQVRALAAERDSAQQALAERRLIDRAKYQLMRLYSLSEDEAYRRLRKLAMDRGLKLAQVARTVLATSPGASSDEK